VISKVWFAEDDRARLQRYVEWLLRLDERASIRVVTRETAAGVYGVTPSGVLTFIAVPLTRIEAAEQPVDEILPARLLVGALKVDAGVGISGDGTGSPALSALPPSDTWLPAERGLVGDLVALIDRSVAQGVAAEAPTWGGFSLDALRVAKGLGLLSHPGAQVVAATNAGWKRLMTPAGQVFMPPARTGRGVLRLVN